MSTRKSVDISFFRSAIEDSQRRERDRLNDGRTHFCPLCKCEVDKSRGCHSQGVWYCNDACAMTWQGEA